MSWEYIASGMEIFIRSRFFGFQASLIRNYWSRDADLAKIFDYDPPGHVAVCGLGGCQPAFFPAFEERLIQDRGDTEIVQDSAGRHVLYFKGRRNGFMPEYIDHPVKDWKTWEGNVKWRLNPETPGRSDYLPEALSIIKPAEAEGKMLAQGIAGAYMYLRCLFGPEKVLYAFYDNPKLVHDCMQTWLKLSDSVTALHQKHFTIDLLSIDEDICYNHGPLISPDMIREFLFPYYQQLIGNMKLRQLDRSRHLYVQVDTDGFANSVIPIYMKGIGMDSMAPFEVAAGCNVVEIGKAFPDLVISGGIDKRVLAAGKEAIDIHLEAIIPTMRKRGGYIPTCDHGVPAEVSLQNYIYYRKRCVELGG